MPDIDQCIVVACGIGLQKGFLLSIFSICHELIFVNFCVKDAILYTNFSGRYIRSIS